MDDALDMLGGDLLWRVRGCVLGPRVVEKSIAASGSRCKVDRRFGVGVLLIIAGLAVVCACMYTEM
jgi:hypothetical protein